MIPAFIYGVYSGLAHWRAALIAYIFQLLLAMALGVQVYHVLDASIGNSLEINKLLGNYDHTVISDLLNVHGASISPLLGQLRWLALTYILFSVFIHAGMLYAVVKNERTWLAFWKGGATYFFSFFKIAILFIAMFGIVSAAIWLPFLPFFFTSPEYFSSEKISVWLLLLVLAFYLIVLFFLYSWSVVVRLHVMQDNSRIWPALRSAFMWMVRRYFSVTGLVLLLFLLHVLLFFIYWLLNDTGTVSLLSVLAFILLQQVAAYLRVMARVMGYGGVWKLWAKEDTLKP